MAAFILNITQPIAVATFIISGICAFILGKHHLAAVNLAIGIANFIIIYGGRFLK